VGHPSSTLGDVIDRFAADLREQLGATMTPAQEAVLGTLERCRTAACGGHLHRCEDCGSEIPIYNGCLNRHCPSCLGHKSAQWLEARAAELLPVAYFHIVFTMPEEVAALALGNKKVVYNILLRAAARTLLEIARDPRHLGAEIGFMAILHTWTQTMLHHPHVHCVVPGGGLSKDGSRWIASRKSFFVHVKVLSALYRGKFLAFLDDAAQSGELRFGGSTTSLAEPKAWAKFLAQMRRKSWVVYAKKPFGSPERVLKYLAGYTHRVAISNRRIVSLTDEDVSFRYRNRKRDNAMCTMILKGAEFLRRFFLHVLPKGFVRIRYYGYLASRARKTKLARCRELLGVPALPPRLPAPETDSTSEDDLIVEHEERLCPACKTGRLRWVRWLRPVRWPPPTSRARPPPGTT